MQVLDALILSLAGGSIGDRHKDNQDTDKPRSTRFALSVSNLL